MGNLFFIAPNVFGLNNRFNVVLARVMYQFIFLLFRAGFQLVKQFNKK